LYAQSSLVTANGGKRWQVGDVCMAKYWQDNEVNYFDLCICGCYCRGTNCDIFSVDQSYV